MMQNRIAYNESCHEEFKDSKMSLTYEVQQNAWRNALTIVNEAEAKWEADCCEWEALGDYHKSWKFCPYCGKPIKISEVE